MQRGPEVPPVEARHRALKPSVGIPVVGPESKLVGVMSNETARILSHRRRLGRHRRRSWLVRRALLLADLVAFSLAFASALAVFVLRGGDGSSLLHLAAFLALLPVWLLAAKAAGLYDRDERRTDYSTIDDIIGILNVVTLAAWVFVAIAWITDLLNPQPTSVVVFWTLAVALAVPARAAARSLCRRSLTYVQNTIIVGTGDVGQLLARKFAQHPEWGINLVGFVDANPKARRRGLENVSLLGTPEELPDLVRLFDIDRVVVAFSRIRHEELVTLVRSLSHLDVRIDVVPRLFEVVGLGGEVDAAENVPLVALPTAKTHCSWRSVKRGIDVLGAVAALTLTAPLFAFIAIRLRLESSNPILAREMRLGMGMQEFAHLRFRTTTARNPTLAGPPATPRYKLRPDEVDTPFGRWLERTSLDRLPQLLNVLRGEMSLVGPRPCRPFEVEQFAPHHFERFTVPAGLTGLRQVNATEHATFGEGLDIDVTYARSGTVALDLRLLGRMPFRLRRSRQATIPLDDLQGGDSTAITDLRSENELLSHAPVRRR